MNSKSISTESSLNDEVLPTTILSPELVEPKLALPNAKNVKFSKLDQNHPYAKSEYFKMHPPIPIFNYIIDNATGKIIEDKTGEA